MYVRDEAIDRQPSHRAMVCVDGQAEPRTEAAIQFDQW